tara:strand:- start:7850 stop:8317 length:468 start_codon:yes stop_codon:yes gene_type:complete
MQEELQPAPHQLAALGGRSMEDLEQWMLEQPQAPYQLNHHFGPGVYIREAVIPAGTIALGHPHRGQHMVVILEGVMATLMDGEVKVISGPATFLSDAGRKLVYVIEDLTIQNIYATEETDIEKLEDMLVDKSRPWDSVEIEDGTQLLLSAVGEVA